MAMASSKPTTGKVWTWKYGDASISTNNPPGVYGAVKIAVGPKVIEGLQMITPWWASSSPGALIPTPDFNLDVPEEYDF